MAIIATNVSQLPIAQKCVKGQDIITKSTSNPDVPGNAAAVATFSAAQAALVAANAAYESNRQDAVQLIAARDAALEAWNTGLNGLAGVTQNATGGVAENILSAGFDVRSPRTPTQPVEQVLNVKVTLNGVEGHSDVNWQPDANAGSYVLECSPDPIAANTFKYVATVSEAKYDSYGATPGQKCWYRVAGVNRLGQGPWSEPALRPVM